MAAKRKAGKAKGEQRTFEEALAELEKVVAELESGEIPLEESIDLYERGIASFKRCHELLRAAEKRIETLVSDGRGGLKTEPFEPEGGEDEAEEPGEGGGLFKE